MADLRLASVLVYGLHLTDTGADPGAFVVPAEKVDDLVDALTARHVYVAPDPTDADGARIAAVQAWRDDTRPRLGPAGTDRHNTDLSTVSALSAWDDANTLLGRIAQLESSNAQLEAEAETSKAQLCRALRRADGAEAAIRELRHLHDEDATTS